MKLGSKPYIYVGTLLLSALVLVGCSCPPCPPGGETPVPTVTPTPGIEPGVLWDDWLDGVNAEIVTDPGARYRLVAAWHTGDGQWGAVPSWAWPYVDRIEGAGGETHCFAGVEVKSGDPLPGKTIRLSWPGGEDGRVTGPDGWANFFTPAKYYPDQGQRGPYCIGPLNGETFCGCGLEYGQHRSVFVLFREREGWEPSLWLRFLDAIGVQSIE